MNINNILNWKFVSSFGKNKVINRTYIYLLIVPALAKLLSKIQNPLMLEVFGSSLEIPIGLPFTWKFFFYSALFFTIGTLIYYATAPAIIKENESFSEFLSKKKTPYHLSNYYENLNFDINILKKTNTSPSATISNAHENIVNSEYFKSLKQKKQKELKAKLVSQLEILHFIKEARRLNTVPSYLAEGQYDAISSYNKAIEMSFWEIYRHATKIKLHYIILCLIFFFLGFLLISYVLFESIQTVILLS